jgi:signal peptidase II
LTRTVCAVVAVLVVDQASKHMAIHSGASGLPDWMVAARNHRLLLGAGRASTSLAVALAVTAMIGLAIYVRRLVRSGAVPAWAIGLLLGGALSNLLDRLFLGAVQDWLATPWAVCNLADLAVLAGAVGLLVARARTDRGVAGPPGQASFVSP